MEMGATQLPISLSEGILCRQATSEKAGKGGSTLTLEQGCCILRTQGGKAALVVKSDSQ